jgi:hypothetical protein
VDHGECVEEARNMAEHTAAGPSKGHGNPYSTVAVDSNVPWSDGPADALALRRAHRREESVMKGLAIVNLLYALYFGTGLAYEFSSVIGHLTGRLEAPWIVQPGWIVMLVLLACKSIAGLGATFGFLWRKRSALWCELTLALSWATMVALDPLIGGPRSALDFVGFTAAHLTLAAPMLSAWYLRKSVVFDARYSDAIAATRRIWFWPRIPAKVILIAFLFFIVIVIAIALSPR